MRLHWGGKAPVAKKGRSIHDPVNTVASMAGDKHGRCEEHDRQLDSTVSGSTLSCLPKHSIFTLALAKPNGSNFSTNLPSDPLLSTWRGLGKGSGQ